MNRWKDWGTGESGNLVDFGILYHRCSVQEFLKQLASSVQENVPYQKIKQAPSLHDEESSRINILSVKNIYSFPLIKYLRQRRIPDSIASQYLQEVSYGLNNKNYYALGFKNDSGGYELRNQYIKAASAPKDSTFINNNAKDLAVFEGFFNFLSYRTMYLKQEEPIRNYLILNSTSFFDKNLSRMLDHQQVHLYLDNDKTGQKFTQKAIETNTLKFIDERKLYSNYKDLNEWAVQIGLVQKQQQKLKP